MKDKELIEAIKSMYYIQDNKLVRYADCSCRGYASHTDCSIDIIQMKIGSMNTRDIVYILHFNETPKGRVIYIDGNRSNHKRENLKTISISKYFEAVNLALKILANENIPDIKIKSPKDFRTYLAKEGLKKIGKIKAHAIVKRSKLERVQRGRAERMIKDLGEQNENM